ncbi:MAG: hypothetical protein CMD97_03750 [Gammaproteobacteria bacterium]|nr:hypothetical protein [Gammaproteobacteria bacterium]MDC0226301.1 hypothetical protein [Gammaproteobacteria bacterium]|tara:strand:+ start:622 stop:1215 length:594 start_codon:yes stop_codon:yes gene_type:complete
MNSHLKKIIILQSLFLIGCGAQNLVIDTFIPTPLVAKNENISASLIFDEKLQNFTFTPEELQKKEASVQISFGDTQVKLFENIFSSFFVLDNSNNNDTPRTNNLNINVKLDKFEYLTPQMAANQKYSVWFKYNIQILNVNDQPIDNWMITGYGEQEAGAFQDDEAFSRAIQIALRDTGANLSIKTQDEIVNIVNSIG